MFFKHLSLLALAGYAFAQDNNQTQSLNATLSGNQNLTQLGSILAANPQIVEVLSAAQNITILAPSNQAFEALGDRLQALASDPEAVSALLLYHVLNGTYTASQVTNTSAFIPTALTEGQFANVTGGQVVEAIRIGDDVVFFSGLLQNSTVSEADLNFTGGVIHVVDSVLTLPENVSSTALAANLTSLYGALNATSLVEAVDTTPDLTIFAPTNEAFQNVGSALENLSIEDVANILQYHVFNGSVLYSTDLENGTSITSLGGTNATITFSEDGDVFVNAARVVTPNVLVANGVVHVIDEVLNPSNDSSRPEPSASEGAPAWEATPAPEPPFTSGLPTPTTQINPTSEGAGPAATESSAGPESTGAAAPMKTGSAGVAALLGVGAAVLMV